MATDITSNQIRNGEVKRADLNTATSGSAVITKVVAGTNVSLSSTGADAGTGDVTVNVSASLIPWTEVTGTSQTIAINNAYIANNASLVTLTLPTTAAVGSVFRIVGKGAGGWKIAQNASQLIHFGSSNTTTGTGGSLQNTNQFDAIELVATVADTTWTVLSSMGNITIV